MNDEVSYETEARKMGWIPESEYHGDKTKYVDAKTYVERGNVVLPILRKANQELQTTVQRQAAEAAELKKMIAASQEAIEELRQYQSEETKRQVQLTKKTLLAELTQAKVDGNVAREVEITEALADVKEAERDVAKPAPKKEEKAPPAEQQLDKDMLDWAERNQWYATDARKRAKANGIANMLRSDPDNDYLVGKAFYDKVTEMMNEKSTPSTSKVEGGASPTENASAGNLGKKGYKDLPPDAKAVCDDPSRMKKLVGKDRAFKDAKAWQEHYAKIYFQGEE